MTKLAAQIRNNNIRQLRGIVPRLKKLIPKDIAEDYSYYDKLDDIQNELIALLNKAKKKKYACRDCCDYENLKQTMRKNTYTCDICRKFTSELFILKG